ncbi:Winged helix DNA-binding domain superfamily [Arabidopsis suecica]|uniref:Winged helix DNA-binding domain superfamily n=1 Tax=Arabidopsis suecica TaxID=45249 RepID=A0A8T1YL59_ARASU|nr:Winged helix DNA-binding domain superfamily [Arabidopsis suecica]
MNENEGSSTSISNFITTIYDMVDDLSSDSIISWSQSGKSFIIWNPEEFYNNLLQRFCFNFKANTNLNCFFSDLDTHGFRKIDSEKWEFANDNFVRGQRHLINNIISCVIEQRVLYDQSMDMFKARKLFARQVKKAEDQLPPHNSYPTSKRPFPTKLYEMVDDPSSDAIISWSQSGRSFIILNPKEFCKDLLRRFSNTLHIPLFFHKLERFGFKKIDPKKWEFANDSFVRGQCHLVEIIINNEKEKIDQLRKRYDRQKKLGEARELFKLQIEEMLDMRKKMKKAKEVKEQEVRLQHHIGLCKL